MTASSLSRACSMPTDTASWPVERWQKPRISFFLYKPSAAISIRLSRLSRTATSVSENVPHSNHVVVHLLQFLLGGAEGVRWRVELVGFEALIREPDVEWLVILLRAGLFRAEMRRSGQDSLAGRSRDRYVTTQHRL